MLISSRVMFTRVYVSAKGVGYYDLLDMTNPGTFKLTVQEGREQIQLMIPYDLTATVQPDVYFRDGQERLNLKVLDFTLSKV